MLTYLKRSIELSWHLFVQELKMWKVLSFDKNLVQFYGSCEQDGKVLLVLEYMEVTLQS